MICGNCKIINSGMDNMYKVGDEIVCIGCLKFLRSLGM